MPLCENNSNFKIICLGGDRRIGGGACAYVSTVESGKTLDEGGGGGGGGGGAQ